MWIPRFIQAVLLMLVFERRLSFRMLYFMKNVNKIILICRWGFGDAVNSTAGLWQIPGEDSRGKPQENYGLFISGGKINGLKNRRNKAN